MLTRELVERLGGHPTVRLGIDLESEAGLGRWLIAACLRTGRVEESTGDRALAALAAAGLGAPAEVAAAGPERVAAVLAAAEYPKPELTAARLARLGAALEERWGGSLERLAADADGLEELGTRLARLASGVGRATVLDFLRPLRDRFAAARETPLSAAARSAAEHLGWSPPGWDADGEPGTLRRLLAEEAAPPALADLESALDRLGRSACRRDRWRSCPLGDDCPRRTALAGGGRRE